MEADAFAPLGRVAKTHGLDGEVSVIMAVDLPESRLIGLEVWFVPPPVSVRGGRITAVRSGPKGPLFTIDTVSDVATAGMIRGCNLLVASKELPELEEGFDPVGMTVVDSERGPIGEVTDVIVTGANDVWVVDGAFGEVLVPAIDQVIDDIDEDSGTIRVTLLDGLLEGE